MRWILQKNLANENGYSSLIKALKHLRTEFHIVNVFDGQMDQDIPMEPNTICVGTTALQKVSIKQCWSPGYYDRGINQYDLIKFYGGAALNNKAQLYTLAELHDHLRENSFQVSYHIRPVDGHKSFAGQVMTPTKMWDWCDRVMSMDVDNSETTLRHSDTVILSPVKEIMAEYRLIIVDGEVVTGSMYRMNGKLKSECIDKDTGGICTFLRSFAQTMARVWSPNKAFAMDIALNREGYHVIEMNSISATGFYDCNMGKVVDAINRTRF